MLPKGRELLDKGSYESTEKAKREMQQNLLQLCSNRSETDAVELW